MTQQSGSQASCFVILGTSDKHIFLGQPKANCDTEGTKPVAHSSPPCPHGSVSNLRVKNALAGGGLVRVYLLVCWFASFFPLSLFACLLVCFACSFVCLSACLVDCLLARSCWIAFACLLLFVVARFCVLLLAFDRLSDAVDACAFGCVV